MLAITSLAPAVNNSLHDAVASDQETGDRGRGGTNDWGRPLGFHSSSLSDILEINVECTGAEGSSSGRNDLVQSRGGGYRRSNDEGFERVKAAMPQRDR